MVMEIYLATTRKKYLWLEYCYNTGRCEELENLKINIDDTMVCQPFDWKELLDNGKEV